MVYKLLHLLILPVLETQLSEGFQDYDLDLFIDKHVVADYAVDLLICSHHLFPVFLQILVILSFDSLLEYFQVILQLEDISLQNALLLVQDFDRHSQILEPLFQVEIEFGPLHHHKMHQLVSEFRPLPFYLPLVYAEYLVQSFYEVLFFHVIKFILQFRVHYFKVLNLLLSRFLIISLSPRIGHLDCSLFEHATFNQIKEGLIHWEAADHALRSVFSELVLLGVVGTRNLRGVLAQFRQANGTEGVPALD